MEDRPASKAKRHLKYCLDTKRGYLKPTNDEIKKWLETSIQKVDILSDEQLTQLVTQQTDSMIGIDYKVMIHLFQSDSDIIYQFLEQYTRKHYRFIAVDLEMKRITESLGEKKIPEMPYKPQQPLAADQQVCSLQAEKTELLGRLKLTESRLQQAETELSGLRQNSTEIQAKNTKLEQKNQELERAINDIKVSRDEAFEKQKNTLTQDLEREGKAFTAVREQLEKELKQEREKSAAIEERLKTEERLKKETADLADQANRQLRELSAQLHVLTVSSGDGNAAGVEGASSADDKADLAQGTGRKRTGAQLRVRTVSSDGNAAGAEGVSSSDVNADLTQGTSRKRMGRIGEYEPSEEEKFRQEKRFRQSLSHTEESEPTSEEEEEETRHETRKRVASEEECQPRKKANMGFMEGVRFITARALEAVGTLADNVMTTLEGESPSP